METQAATLPANPPHNGRNLDTDKERIATLTLVGVNASGKPEELAQARFWMARKSDGASPVYCSVWIYTREHHSAGHGRARGYGYHKQSAALQAALDSAGIKLAHAIDGVGDAAMRDALIAVGVAMGHKVDALAVLS